MPEQGEPILSTPNAPTLTEGVDQSSDTVPHIRALQVEFKKEQTMFDLESGDLLIKDVPLLAEGEWTDSAQQTPLYYPAKTLSEYADNWVSRSGYNRHVGGVPRDSSNKVSEAINPHFGHFLGVDGAEHAAIISDLIVYGNTPSGRAMQEMIKRKNIRFVSVEHGGDEAVNPQTRRMEAASLVFGGFAFVNKGACKVCRINEAPAEQPKPEEQPVEVGNMTEVKELEAQIAAQGLLIKELSEAIKAPKVVEAKPVEAKADFTVEIAAALDPKMKELADANAALLARIDALEKDGASKTSVTEMKELGAVEQFAVYDAKKGTIIGA